MSDRPAVVLALSPPVEHTIQPLLFGDHAAVTVTATVAESPALDRVIRDSHGAEALLVSADLPGLTPALLTQARSRGLRLIGIAANYSDAQALRELPLDAVLDTSPRRSGAAGSDPLNGRGGRERRLEAARLDGRADRPAERGRGRCSRSSVAAAHPAQASSPPHSPRSRATAGRRCSSNSTCSAAASRFASALMPVRDPYSGAPHGRQR